MIPATAAEAKSVARDKSPLPRKTERPWQISRSLSSPRRSRSAPMNHKGNAREWHQQVQRQRLCPNWSSAKPALHRICRTESRNNKRPEIMRTEKRIPALAAADGVFKRTRIKFASCFHQLPRNIHGNRVEQPAWSGSRKLGLSRGTSLLIDVTRWQSPCSNPFVENFLLQRKGDPFLRRIGIGPQTAKLQENFLFALFHPLALE
jgi:hypothetical protein